MSHARTTVAALTFVVVVATCVSAAEITVPGDHPTIQDAIDAAVDGDVVLVSPGTYTGPGNRDISLWGKAITLKSTDGPLATVIDAEGSPQSIHGGFTLVHGETRDTVVDGFTITGGYLAGDTGGVGPQGGGGGAGVFIRESSPIIQNCIIHNNIAATAGNPFIVDGKGGGVNINGISTAVFENCIITENASGRHGGGVITFSDTAATFRNCVISHNRSGHLFSGAGMLVGGDTLIMNTTVVGNQNDSSGGGLVGFGLVVLTNCIVWENSAPTSPQIRLVEEVEPGLTTAVIESSTIQGGLGDISLQGNVTLEWRGNIDQDPLFFDSPNRDYHLLQDSPCVDHGKLEDKGISKIDLEGNPRIQHCRIDMGPYESSSFADCNDNDLADTCEAHEGTAADCNGNAIPDECDIDSGVAADCDDNGIPDGCEPDGDDDSVTDACDNCELPNPKQLDCQPNGIGDVCDLAHGSSADCNANAVPDACDVDGGGSADVLPPKGDGIPDECQSDCNANHIPDLDDVATGSSPDDDENLVPDECQCAIRSSMPPDGAIDARQPSAPDGSNAIGWDSVELVMCDRSEELVRLQHFEVSATGGSVLEVHSIAVDGDRVRVMLTAPIPLAECTQVRHVPSGSVVHLAHLPGDVTSSRTVTPSDILWLVDHLNGVLPMQPWQCDINRSGLCEPQDIIRLIDLQNGAGTYEPWRGVWIPECP